MKLKTQKRAALATVALVGVMGLGYGVTQLFNGASSENPSTVIVERPAPVIPPVTPLPAEPNQPGLEERKAVIATLVATDKEGLESHGYTMNGLLTPFGKACNNDGTTDGTGYHGNTTAISYDVSKNGQSGKACISHDADGEAHVVVKMSTLTPPPQVSADQQRVLSALEASDRKRLADKGITVTSLLLPFGKSCRDDGTTDGAGYNGPYTSLAYRIVRDGQTGKVCIAHDNVGTGSHATLKMD